MKKLVSKIKCFIFKKRLLIEAQAAKIKQLSSDLEQKENARRFLEVQNKALENHIIDLEDLPKRTEKDYRKLFSMLEEANMQNERLTSELNKACDIIAKEMTAKDAYRKDLHNAIERNKKQIKENIKKTAEREKYAKRIKKARMLIKQANDEKQQQIRPWSKIVEVGSEMEPEASALQIELGEVKEVA